MAFKLTLDQWGLLVAALSLLLALLVAVVPPIRRATEKLVDALLVFSGSADRKYRRFYLAEYGKVRNVYLGRPEELDLVQTYVPLSVYSTESGTEDRRLASAVLGDVSRRRVLILGDAGTGKTTLLKAYGAATLRAFVPGSAGHDKRYSAFRQVPFFVSLRRCARFLVRRLDASLLDFILDEELAKV